MLKRALKLFALALVCALVAASAAGAQRHARTYEFFYTTSSPGNVWRSNFVVTAGAVRLTPPVAAAAVPSALGVLPTAVKAGAVVDRYTSDVITARNEEVTASDPRTGATVSRLDLGNAVSRCRHVSTDNRGALIVACGHAVVLLQLTPTRRLDSPGTSVTVRRLPVQVTEIGPTFTSSNAVRARRCRRHCTHPVFTG